MIDFDNEQFEQNRKVPHDETVFCLIACNKKTTKNGDPMLSLTYVPACDAGKRTDKQEYSIVNFNTTAGFVRPIGGKPKRVGLIMACQQLHALGTPKDQMTSDIDVLHELGQNLIGECLTYNHYPSATTDGQYVNFGGLDIGYEGLTHSEFESLLGDFTEADPDYADGIVKEKTRRNLSTTTGQVQPEGESAMEASDYADV